MGKVNRGVNIQDSRFKGVKGIRVAVDAGCFSKTGNLIFFRFTPQQDGTAHVPK